MKRFFRILTAVLIGWFMDRMVSAAVPDATFLSVSGKTTVEDKTGKIRQAQKGSQAFEGEKVVVEKEGTATLKLFDGSMLEVSPDTQIVINTLKKPSVMEKKIRFDLLSGMVLAKVKKLLMPSSLFEIEAGGVVCGVRGTQFSVAYDPGQSRVDLKVAEGSVYTIALGKTLIVPAGQEKEFLKGSPLSGTTQAAPLAQVQTQSLGPTTPQEVSLALEDLNIQFVSIISPGRTGTLTAPVLGSTLNSTVQLTNSVVPGGISLLGLPLKIGP